jgi:hypothetical protein
MTTAASATIALCLNESCLEILVGRIGTADETGEETSFSPNLKKTTDWAGSTATKSAAGTPAL